ncbi:hypothetical protein MAPG_06184 [Magnaporthiopsis poae ATCC 64411]|uniref:Ankyrin repeat protein n=1 Tax=Magnaporthiopsis poae (strain ATCC 64411 / 73-15) TaxID=644358 RepID=A0A0C4E1C7_MAGP6|nr:hypothetical protein MAPG_06184 [Magnaporthiopsis poae ATCC 64411]
MTFLRSPRVFYFYVLPLSRIPVSCPAFSHILPILIQSALAHPASPFRFRILTSRCDLLLPIYNHTPTTLETCPRSTMDLQARLGRDCFLLVVEQLVATVGVRKALRLRAVDRTMNWAIMYALCTSQVLKIPHSPALPLFINARIHLANSRKLHKPQDTLTASIAKMNEALDLMILQRAGSDEEDSVASRHLLVAEALVGRDLADKTPRLTESVTSLGCPVYTVQSDTTDQNLLGGAIAIGDLALTRLLLDRLDPAAVSDKTCFGRPVIVAAAFGRDDIFDLLVERGAEVTPQKQHWNVLDPRADTVPVVCPFVPRYIHGDALQAASSAGSEYILGRILSIMSLAIQSDRSDAIQSDFHAIRPPPPPSTGAVTTHYFHACMLAARGAHVGVMKTLFDHLGGDPAACQGLLRSMMQEACTHGQEKAVEFLLDSGFDVTERICDVNDDFFYDPNRRSVLSIPASHGNYAITRLLLDRGVRPYNLDRRDKRPPILDAARNGHEQVVCLLLDPKHRLPGLRFEDLVSVAARHREERLVRMLLRPVGREILARPHEPMYQEPGGPGYTLGHALLSIAIKTVSTDLIELLLSLGVPLNKGWGRASKWPLAQAYDRPWLFDFLRSLGAEQSQSRPPKQGPASFNQAFGDMEKVVYRRDFVAPRELDWIGKY